MTGFSKAFYKTLFLAFLFSMAAFVSCKTASPARPASSGGAAIEKNEDSPFIKKPAGSVSEEIRGLIESGRLSSMLQASELIEERNLSSAEFGRVMNGIVSILAGLVYPDSEIRLPPPDLPLANNYARIIREAEKGNYVPPPFNSSDFFEYALPFLSINDNTPQEVLEMIMEDLEKARKLRPLSALPFYFRGLIFERLKFFEEAAAAFAAAYEVCDECYSALVGIARVTELSGGKKEAAAQLAALALRYPGNMRIKRRLALILYEDGGWERALPLVEEVLQRTPRDAEFLLMKAGILIKDGQYAKALAALESYPHANQNDRLYLLLRAKAQYEGYRNSGAALNYLRAIIRGDPDDEEALIFAAALLMESRKGGDHAEGRDILARLRQSPGASAAALALSLQDAVGRESWREARLYLAPLLAVRRDAQALQNAYLTERGFGNDAAALAYARELYNRDASNNEYAAVCASALIDNGLKEEASRIIEKLLTAPSGAAGMSRYYYLRARLRDNDEDASADLFLSLYEDPRNLDALAASFEMCLRRGEVRRAAYYLKQAISIAPENLKLRRYEAEYAELLGRE
jgi:tetratricopeptide (TPR) repeat protein